MRTHLYFLYNLICLNFICTYNIVYILLFRIQFKCGYITHPNRLPSNKRRSRFKNWYLEQNKSTDTLKIRRITVSLDSIKTPLVI